MTILRQRVLAVLCAGGCAAGCHSQIVDDHIMGRMGTVHVAIPHDIVASGVMSAGESAWDPRTDRSGVSGGQIDSFDVALNRATLRLVRFHDGNAAERMDHDANIFADIDRLRVPSSDAGIAARHRDFVVGQMHRAFDDETAVADGLRTVQASGPAASENRGFDSNYFSEHPTVNISCSRDIEQRAPHRDYSTCYEDFALPQLQSGVRVYIKKSEIARWAEIRQALINQVSTIVLSKKG